MAKTAQTVEIYDLVGISVPFLKIFAFVIISFGFLFFNKKLKIFKQSFVYFILILHCLLFGIIM